MICNPTVQEKIQEFLGFFPRITSWNSSQKNYSSSLVPSDCLTVCTPSTNDHDRCNRGAKTSVISPFVKDAFIPAHKLL